MKILGIETSCDETSAAIIETKDKSLKILSNIVSSQIDIHKKYKGVYPEVASRLHLEKMISVINNALKKAKTKMEGIDAISVTTGPGLVGSLLVGVNTAKSLAYTLDKPILTVNHLEGHIYANFIDEARISFPLICLIVSGGHTCLVLMQDHGNYQIVGQTHDDAAGEAFDKVAVLLGLPYPGGPSIEKTVQKAKLKSKNEKLKIKLPRPMIKSEDFNFSFSGLKTAVLYLIKQIKSDKIKDVRRDIAVEFQQAIIDVLTEKTLKAAKTYKVKTVMLAGGVAANQFLRKTLKQRMKSELSHIIYHISPIMLSTDNAAMIAIAGYFKVLKSKYEKWYNVRANANLTLKNW